VLSVNRYAATAANFRSPLAVNFSGSGTGRVTSSPTGLSCTANCSELFDARTVVTLTAAPDAGDGFDGWSGACTNTTGSCRVHMDAAKSVTALFVAERRVTVTRTGTGTGTVTSSPAGVNCGSTCGADFLPGAVVQFSPVAATNSQFRGWTGDCDRFNVPCIVTMDRAKNVGAIFDLKPLVSVAATGGGRVTSSPLGIDCGPSCSARFPFDEHITLTATPDSGSGFAGWGGDCAATGTHTTCTIHFLEGARNITAHFSGAPALTIQMAGGGNGRVTSSPGGIDCGGTCSANYATGAVVTVTAAPASGSVFSGWSGSCTGNQRTCTLTLNSSATVMAIFDMTAPPGGDGGGSGGGGGGGGAFGWLSLLALSGLALRRRTRISWAD
jgi:hypothetical protein